MILKVYKTVLTASTLIIALSFMSCEKKKVAVDDEKVFYQTGFCEDCHNNTLPGHNTNAHQKHTTGLYKYDCSTCHYGHGWEKSSHMNKETDVNFNLGSLATRNGSDGNLPVWNPETKTCSDVYCHSNGVTADRGTDGTYTWSLNSPPFGNMVYATTPAWDKGEITGCESCHPGSGNMEEPYLIERPNTLTQLNYPATGQHRLLFHMSNNSEYASAPYDLPGWDGVQCFWCHSVNATDITSINGPTNQGTYGTEYHIDGATYFKPLNISNGGTIISGSRYSGNGSEAHCGEGKKCW